MIVYTKNLTDPHSGREGSVFNGLSNGSATALHEARILANDPGTNFILRLVP